MPIDASFIPQLAKKARLRFDRHSGKHMLMYPERGLELNESAAEIAKRCDGTSTIAEIADAIVSEKALAPEVRADIVRDAIELLEGFRKKGLLEIRE